MILFSTSVPRHYLSAPCESIDFLRNRM